MSTANTIFCMSLLSHLVHMKNITTNKTHKKTKQKNTRFSVVSFIFTQNTFECMEWLCIGFASIATSHHTKWLASDLNRAIAINASYDQVMTMRYSQRLVMTRARMHVIIFLNSLVFGRFAFGGFWNGLIFSFFRN